jgi:hypothetical protein
VGAAGICEAWERGRDELSADPAVGEYIPEAPVNEEARERNGKLPGMGGIYNVINMHLYHYAGNNPVKYTDPDGESPYDSNISRLEGGGGRSRADRMEIVQDLARNARMYKQGGGGRGHLLGPDLTVCNQATFDVAEALGFYKFALYNGVNRDNVRANDAARNLARSAASGSIMEVTGEQAQTLANNGFLVIAAMENPGAIGHISSVRPTDTPYNLKNGPMLSNVGPLSRTGIKSTVDSFGQNAYDSGKVKFYVYPNQSFKYDTTGIAKPNN